ncbi:MAG: hypothetical protein MJ175_08685 [Clostridia bacterium]|nr:hypothetical protein [Clostridia bacterium]
MKQFVKNSAVWLLLLSMFLCLFVSGCESKSAANANGKKPDVADAKIPEKTQLEVQAEAELYYENMFRYYPCRYDMAVVQNIRPALSAGGYIYGFGINEVYGGIWLMKFDMHGNLVSESKMGGYTTKCSVIDEDRYMIAANFGGYSGLTAAILKEDGSVIDYVEKLPVADHPSSPYVEQEYGKQVSDILIYLGDDCILVGYYFDLYVFRNGLSGGAVRVDLPGAIEGIERLDDHTLLMFSPKQMNDTWESLFHTIDMDTGEVSPYAYDDAHPDPTKIFENIEYLYYQDGTYYARCKDGIYSYRDGERKFLLSWEESYLNSGTIDIIQVLNDDCFVVGYKNALTLANETGCLIRETLQREKPRQVVTLASVGISQEYNRFVQSAVDEFNRSSTEYLVYYHDYESVYRLSYDVSWSQRAELAQQDFEFDLINGVVYDSYIFPGDSTNLKMLSDKNALIDLSPYLDEGQLFGCVEDYCRGGNGILGVPFFFRLSTLITQQDTLASTKKLTWDLLYEFAENLKPGESLFDEKMFERLKQIGPNDFIDSEQKTCSFDSEEYIRYLQLLREIYEGKYYDIRASVIITEHTTPFENYESHQGFELLGVDAQKRSQSGQLKFSLWDFCTRKSLDALMLAYQHQNINYCGYPSKNETAVLMDSDAILSVTSIAECPEGAAAFMKYLFSDYIQASQAVSHFGLPVTKSALKAIFPIGHIYYFPTDVASVYDDPVLKDAISFFGIVQDKPTNYDGYFAHVYVTDEDCEKFIRFLDRARAIKGCNSVVRSIIDEEVSYYVGGVRSAEDTARIIQNRLYIYLNE